MKKCLIVLFVLIGLQFTFCQELERPFIWVNKSNRKDILQKIEESKWTKTFYEDFLIRLNIELAAYEKDPNNFLRQLPFDSKSDSDSSIPKFRTFIEFSQSENDGRLILMKYLQMGIDCGVVYYLTQDKRYAQCSLDILYTITNALLQISPADFKSNGGWLYPQDNLREAREIGAQIPILYDFIYPFIKEGCQPNDFVKKQKIDYQISEYEKVFKSYATLVIEHGHTGSNWSVLESPCLVYNALALSNKEDSAKLLHYYLEKGNDTQDALPVIALNFQKEGDIYPETSHYSNAVPSITNMLMLVLNQFDPNLHLARKYPNLLFAIDRWNDYRYPNQEIIRFGDGHRTFDEPFFDYEVAYLLSKREGLEKLSSKFGSLLSTAIKNGEYNRPSLEKRSYKPAVYNDPLSLLWFEADVSGEIINDKLPRTDNIDHAGVYLQRNLSVTKKPKDGFMCFVGGNHYVHSHSTGMDMELYGEGEVLGVDNGLGKYRTDKHENYARLFAAHNSVIVNGASQGEGDWVNLGINKVGLIAMEPRSKMEALSPNFSFTRTSFMDDKGDKAEAKQERTLALIRTSPETGYYVDVFRSKSQLQNEYHDYIYHNIGDEIQFSNTDLNLKTDSSRFMANANSEWKQNRSYRNPGWHFFKKVKSSNEYSKDIKAQFLIEKIVGRKIYMNSFILGSPDREYSTVMAPETSEAPKPYDTMPTPTLIIRKKGEAWMHPFAVIYEPTSDKKTYNGILNVTKIDDDGIFKGFEITNRIGGKTTKQLIIVQSTNQEYKDVKRNLYFKGGFAIVSYNEKGEIQDIYIGDGSEFSSETTKINSFDGKDISVFISIGISKTTVKNSGKLKVKFPKGETKVFE